MGRGGQSHFVSGSPSSHVLPPIPSNDDYGRDPEVWDVVVVGAGVAGSALAYSQGRDGRRVLLLERDLSQPDRIVGELLQPGGYLMLKRLGLEHAVDGIDSQKVYGYCMFKDEEEAKVNYPTEGFDGDVAGRSFHNGRFVQRLRQAAASMPSITVRQGIAKRLLNERGEEWREDSEEAVSGVLYKAADGSERTARADLSIICDGMYSSLRNKLSTPNIRHPSFFVGLLLHNAALPYANFGHVVLAKPSPILFYPISSSEVRCLVDVPGERLPSELPEYLRANVAPQVPKQLRSAFLEAIEAGRIRSMQNKLMPAAPIHRPGALLLGDAFNMRHPLTGGGMTVALSDTLLLCDMLRPLPDFSDSLATAATTHAFYTRRKPLSATINTLANALYQVFCYRGSAAHEEMRQACFDYLRLGGWYSAGPVSLLSGLNPRPSVLVMHFFAVAIFGVGRLLLPRPTLRGVWMGVLLLWCAACIILPIIQGEGIVAVFFPYLVRRPQLVKPATMKHAFSSQDLHGALSRTQPNVTSDKLKD
ncbi:Squalene epoxidase 1 [Coccomyxa sp. Obi]|nr:Squalene epoxidase 1 [Coccomyxa sp. Obi]